MFGPCSCPARARRANFSWQALGNQENCSWQLCGLMNLLSAQVVGASHALAFPQGFSLCVGSWAGSGAAPSYTQQGLCSSTQHRRDCHLLLLHQPGIWPCSLPKAEDTDQTSISVTVILDCQFSEGLRGGTEKRFALSEPLHRELQLVKSQVHLKDGSQ